MNTISSLVPFLAAMLAALFVVMVIVYRSPHRRIIKVDCDDDACSLPPHCVVAHYLYQVPWRVVDSIEMDVDEVLLHSDPERGQGSIGGMDLLKHLQRHDAVSGYLVCPYPYPLAWAIVQDPKLYPPLWHGYRVWFFVPFWVNEPDTEAADSKRQLGTKGLHVYGIECQNGKPVLIRRSLAENFCPCDMVAVKLMKDLQPSSNLVAIES